METETEKAERERIEKEKADKAIENLRNYHQESAQTFDFYTAMILAGNHNKQLRRQVIAQVTGKILPVSKCNMYAAADALKNYFNQPTLF